MMQTGRQNASGQTLLELIMATSIVAATLVPALRLMRNGMSYSREVDRLNMMTNYCISKLEEHLAIVAASWTAGNTAGDFSADGHADLRYIVQRSDAPGDGGITDRLMNVAVTVFDDLDQNDLLGPGEPDVVFRSKMARLVTYEYEAGS